jgi:protein TonB
MATTPSDMQRPRGWRSVLAYTAGGSFLGFLLFGLALLLLLLLAWYLSQGGSTPQRERVVQQISIVQPPPPPPPPPEPEEKIMEEEPEIVEPTDAPEKPAEKPAEQPSEAPAEPTPSTQAAGLDRPADAGSDSFRLAAGGGGGFFGRGGGGGGGGGGWGRSVEAHIERALQRDSRTRVARGFVRVRVNIDADGRFVGAALQSTTGNATLDAAIRDVLGGLPPLGRRRPPDQNGLTNATINMKRTDG